MDNAAAYSSANPMQRRDAAKTVKEFVKKMRWGSRETVLDVGCGPGDVTANILIPELPDDATCVGADLSEGMVQHAATHHGDDRLSFIQLDIGSSDVLDQVARPATKLFSFYCLHWVMDQRRAASNIFGLLAPGGEALLVLLASSALFEIFERMFKMPDWAPFMQDVQQFISPYQHADDPRSAFHELLTEAGLEVLHCSCREQHFDFPSMEIFEKTLMVLNPFLKRIPADKRQRFVDDYVATAVDLCELQDESVRTNYGLLVAHARKP